MSWGDQGLFRVINIAIVLALKSQLRPLSVESVVVMQSWAVHRVRPCWSPDG